MLLDRFYTPRWLAERLVQSVDGGSSKTCLDAHCGTGALLDAYQDHYPDATCFGMDKDARVVDRLRRARPRWRIAKLDLMKLADDRDFGFLRGAIGCDHLVLNPPFSAGDQKARVATVGEKTVRCSLAMSHILTALELFDPREGGAAVVPESLLYAEVDEAARALLLSKVSIVEVAGLKNSTFSGARANACLISLRPQGRSKISARVRAGRLRCDSRPKIVRGGVPVFESRRSRAGLSYIHSTDLRRVSAGGLIGCKMKVRPIGRGTVEPGPTVMIPRVGMPDAHMIAPVVLHDPVQLSDCVIALRFDDIPAALRFCDVIKQNFVAIACALYRGTGARYTTIKRLEALLDKIYGRS